MAIKKNAQCIRCVNRDCEECNGNDKFLVRECENFKPRMSENSKCDSCPKGDACDMFCMRFPNQFKKLINDGGIYE